MPVVVEKVPIQGRTLRMYARRRGLTDEAAGVLAFPAMEPASARHRFRRRRDREQTLVTIYEAEALARALDVEVSWLSAPPVVALLDPEDPERFFAPAGAIITYLDHEDAVFGAGWVERQGFARPQFGATTIPEVETRSGTTRAEGARLSYWGENAGMDEITVLLEVERYLRDGTGIEGALCHVGLIFTHCAAVYAAMPRGERRGRMAHLITEAVRKTEGPPER